MQKVNQMVQKISAEKSEKRLKIDSFVVYLTSI
jgi:hypothetical protein